ncbi:Ger(x)C family spore germination protein [Bacillus sp. JJ1764]|uniref:Ger(x)C family spore germination protein n=1 Tax=Bacillus sp. JJ1764 TaxID=3122964 RepID=UPI003000DCE6
MKLRILIGLLFMLVFLSGCWDKRELSDITVVMGIAIDKSDDGKFTLSVEGLNAQELNRKTAYGYAPSIVFTLEGNTAAELTQKMNIGISRNLIYSHMRTLVISEEVAKEGISSFLDFMERNREIRDDFNILISRDVKAVDVLKTTYQFQKSSSLKLHTQLQSMVENWGGDPDVRLNDVIMSWTSPGKQPVMAALTIKGDPEKGGNVNNMNDVTPKALVVLDSLAIFKKDRLKGFLPLSSARNYLIIVDKLKKTVVSVPCGKNKYFGIRIYNSKTRTSAKLIKGIPVINLKIRTEAYLDGMQCEDDLTSLDTYDKFEKISEQQLKQNLESTINKMQNKYKLDIFGFGEALYRQDYQNFKKVKNKWDQVFQHAIVQVDIKVQLRRSGIRTKSLISK